MQIVGSLYLWFDPLLLSKWFMGSEHHRVRSAVYKSESFLNDREWEDANTKLFNIRLSSICMPNSAAVPDSVEDNKTKP